MVKKEELIEKIERTTSAIGFLKMKGEILEYLSGSKKAPKED